MNLKEYNEVKNLNYLEYCDYLQKKYRISQVPYFTKNGSKNPKAKRTKDGLMIHHKMEDHAVLLSLDMVANLGLISSPNGRFFEGISE